MDSSNTNKPAFKDQSFGRFAISLFAAAFAILSFALPVQADDDNNINVWISSSASISADTFIFPYNESVILSPKGSGPEGETSVEMTLNGDKKTVDLGENATWSDVGEGVYTVSAKMDDKEVATAKVYVMNIREFSLTFPTYNPEQDDVSDDTKTVNQSKSNEEVNTFVCAAGESFTIEINGHVTPDDLDESDMNIVRELANWVLRKSGSDEVVDRGDFNQFSGEKHSIAVDVEFSDIAEAIENETTLDYILEAKYNDSGDGESGSRGLYFDIRVTPLCAEIDAEVESISTRFSLGPSKIGRSQGVLILEEEEEIHSELLHPSFLVYSFREGFDTFRPDQELPGAPYLQILSGDRLTSIDILNEYAYQIAYHSISSIGNLNANGYYDVNPTDAYSLITIEDPDQLSEPNRLRITTEGDNAGVIEYSVDNSDPLGSIWAMAKGTGNEQVVHTVQNYIEHDENDEPLYEYEIRKIFDSSDNLVSERETKSKYFTFGLRKIKDTRSGLGIADDEITEWFYYDDFHADHYQFGLLRKKIEPNGYWERYEYDRRHRIRKITKQYNGSSPESSEDENWVVLQEIDDTLNIRTTTEYVMGDEISRRWQIRESEGMVRDIVAVKAGVYWNDSENVMETVTYRSSEPWFTGRPTRRIHPNGTIETWNYERDEGVETITTNHARGASNEDQTEVVSGQVTTTVTDLQGNLQSSETHDVETNILLDSRTIIAFDHRNRPTEILHHDGTVTERVYQCCGLAYEINREGIKTRYFRDSLSRVTTTYRELDTGTEMLRDGQEHELDALGRRIKTYRIGTDNASHLVSERTYDPFGRLISEKDAHGNETTHSEIIDENGLIVRTTTFPDGSTRVVTSTPDGLQLSVSGTAAAPMKWEYGVDPLYGQWTKQIRVGENDAETEWTKNYRDLAGRAHRVEYSDGAVETMTYNNKGQMVKQTDATGLMTIFTYNERGERYETITPVSGSTDPLDPEYAPDYAGTDRITRNITDVTTFSDQGSSYDVRRTRTYVYSEDDTGAAGGTLASTTYQSTDGFVSWQESFGTLQRRERHLLGDGNRLEVNTNPDGSRTEQLFTFGRLQIATTYDANDAELASQAYAYDEFGRQIEVVDSRTGTTTINYNDLNQV
ncbi:MAG: hypothetical protein LAT58_07870, partial [Opitutales bacterium]|nr:hypothetical protein [Opitutales bacterium]